MGRVSMEFSYCKLEINSRNMLRTTAARVAGCGCRNEARQSYRSGHYGRNLTTTSGDVTLHVPRKPETRFRFPASYDDYKNLQKAKAYYYGIISVS